MALELVCAHCGEPFVYHMAACPQCGSDAWEPAAMHAVLGAAPLIESSKDGGKA